MFGEKSVHLIQPIISQKYAFINSCLPHFCSRNYKNKLIRMSRENTEIQMDKNEKESKQKPERMRLKRYEREKWLDRGIGK